MADGSDRELAEEEALEKLVNIARQLAESDSLDETLQRIVDLSRDYLDNCDGSTLMLVRGGQVVTPASTDLDAYKADKAQHETGEGPCLSAMREHETIVIDDIPSDERWPRWRAKVSSLGWCSMVGLRLFVAEDTMGALDVYSRQTDGFDRHSQALARFFAAHAAVAMKAAISDAGLQRALESRDIIGQAKGILMERERLSGQQAFERLRQLSNAQNVKVRELAQHITESGEVPPS